MTTKIKSATASGRKGANPAEEKQAKPARAKNKAAQATIAETAATPTARAKRDAPPSPKSSEPETAGRAGGAKPAPTASNEAPQPARGDAFATLAALTPAQRENLEKLSANLARAALTAQGALTEAALRQVDRPSALTADPFHVGPALTEVIGRLAVQPDRMMRAQASLFARYLDLWRSTALRLTGESAEPVVQPAKSDRRFSDPDWSSNPLFDAMKQSYLLTSNWLNDLVGEIEGVDPLSKRRVEFFMKMLTDAFSPSNFLISNPAALREIAATNGESLLRGMEHFAADLERGGGQLSISQTDSSPFKVGENIASAPGKVIFQNDLIQLLQFEPTTAKVHEIPLLIFPPWINKYYIMDLQPANSMIRWLAAQGFTVFVASWVNPDQQMSTRTFEDYMQTGAYGALGAVIDQTGVDRVNTVGYCIGGTMLSCVLAHMAAKNDPRIASATFFAAQQDFSEAGDLLLFTDDVWLNDVERLIDAEGGVLSGQSMAGTFNALRANDLIWSFFVNNYLMGKEPKPFDLLYWNSDQTRMPKTLHLYYLREFYKENSLAKGTLTLCGETMDLGRVKTPVFVQSSKEDHIAPYRSVYKGARLFGGPVTFLMAGSGHIAGVINAPSANKYQYWTNETLPASAEDWIAGAVEHPGSWWPYWSKWLAEKSGPMVPARDPSKGPLKPIEDAPGSFVKVRS